MYRIGLSSCGFYLTEESFQKLNNSGIWLYEIGLKSPDTLKRSRDLTFGDFVRNADEIFNGKALTRIP